jgi:hypothetical protein
VPAPFGMNSAVRSALVGHLRTVQLAALCSMLGRGTVNNIIYIVGLVVVVVAVLSFFGLR